MDSRVSVATRFLLLLLVASLGWEEASFKGSPRKWREVRDGYEKMEAVEIVEMEYHAPAHCFQRRALCVYVYVLPLSDFLLAFCQTTCCLHSRKVTINSIARCAGCAISNYGNRVLIANLY